MGNMVIHWNLAKFNGLVLLGKSTPETHGFLPSNSEGFPVPIFPSSNSMKNSGTIIELYLSLKIGEHSRKSSYIPYKVRPKNNHQVGEHN